VFSGRCYEGLEIGIESKRDGKRVLNFVEFQNVFTYFGIFDGLCGMLAAFGEMILETMFERERMQAVRTNESLSVVVCSVTYESRKTRNEGVMKFVFFRQQQKIHVVGTLITKLRSVYGNQFFPSYTKTLIEMDGFWFSNFGMDEMATGVSIPVMSSSLMNLL